MSYVVLARKWRPTQFDEVVGQGHVARTLKNAIEQDRVHHAFLFCGARGVGKTSTARILAKAMNCRSYDAPTTTPCGECESCEQIAAGQSIDVFEIDGASNRGINEIRELRESVRYAPSRDRYKVYIIDEVHMLTTEAFNALLKTLEEPPPHAKFIFATTEPQKIPVTILSRCQRYDFKRIGQSDIVDHLERLADEEGMKVERGALQVLARQAAGGMRDAVSLLDQVVSFAEGEVTEEGVVEVLGVANRRHLFELSEALIARDTERALLTLDEVNRYGYDLGQFASEFLTHLRDLMVVKVVERPERVTEMTATEIESARGQVTSIDENLLHRMFSVTTKAAQEMARSAFPKLVFEMALVRMAQLEPLAGLDVMISRLAELEKAFDGEALTPMEPAAEKKKPVASSESRGASLEQAAPAVEAIAPVEEAPAASDEEPETPTEEPPAAPVEEAPATSDEAQETPTEEPPAEPVEEAPEASDEEPETPTEEPPAAPVEEAPATSDEEPETPEAPIARLPLSALEEMGTSERWKKVVEAMRTRSAPIAAAAEHAYVERFADGEIELSFADKYLDFINEGERLEKLRAVVSALFGDTWKVLLATRNASTGAKTKTIAQEKEEDRDRRRKNLEIELRESDVVKQVQELFDVPEEEVKVQVALFDDPV